MPGLFFLFFFIHSLTLNLMPGRRRPLHLRSPRFRPKEEALRTQVPFDLTPGTREEEGRPLLNHSNSLFSGYAIPTTKVVKSLRKLPQLLV